MERNVYNKTAKRKVVQKEGLPKSQAIHRREALAEARRSPYQDEANLQKHKERLEQDNLTSQERATLKAEIIWLEFKLGRIDTSQRSSSLQKLLDDLKKEDPHIFSWLIGEDQEDGLSPLGEIRDRVMQTGGYYTKRGRKF